MSPFFLIEAGKLHERAGLSRSNHLVLFPVHVKDWLQTLFSSRQVKPEQHSRRPLRSDSAAADASVPKRVTLTMHLHPADNAAMHEAARKVGMEEAEFCALAIHRASRCVIQRGTFHEIV